MWCRFCYNSVQLLTPLIFWGVVGYCTSVSPCATCLLYEECIARSCTDHVLSVLADHLGEHPCHLESVSLMLGCFKPDLWHKPDYMIFTKPFAEFCHRSYTSDNRPGFGIGIHGTWIQLDDTYQNPAVVASSTNCRQRVFIFRQENAHVMGIAS